MVNDEHSEGVAPARVALVTGATRGIGRQVVRLLVDRGYRVAAFGRVPDRLRDLATEYRDTEVLSTHLADVTDREAVRREVDRAHNIHGRLDAVVNNAGIAGFDAPIDRVTPEVWANTLAVNLDSIYHVSQAAIPFLQAGELPIIVNVSSVHALATAANVAPYAASKGASASLSRAMALDLEHYGIRVVAVLPGATDTEMLAEYEERQGQSLHDMGFSAQPNAIGRIMRAEEVAEVIAFLVSPQASALNGCVIPVDAGLTSRL